MKLIWLILWLLIHEVWSSNSSEFYVVHDGYRPFGGIVYDIYTGYTFCECKAICATLSTCKHMCFIQATLECQFFAKNTEAGSLIADTAVTLIRRPLDYSCHPSMTEVSGIGCVQIVEVSLSFSAARSYCQTTLKADIFIALSAAHFDRFITAFTPAITKDVWVGASGTSWMNGRAVAAGEWGPGEPRNNAGPCVGIFPKTLLLASSDCTEIYYFACLKKMF